MSAEATNPAGLTKVVVVDYGSVLTNPLAETFCEFAALTGLDTTVLAEAFLAATEKHGETPMAALEIGAISERQMADRILAELPPGSEKVLDDHEFGELWFRGRRPNQPFVDFLRELRANGRRLALLTNNVREWEPRWRAQLPVDELFEVVVDSHKEGVRKPDPKIYRILLERLGVEAHQCLFVDDTEENCAAARELGIRSVLFTDTDTAVREVLTCLEGNAPDSEGTSP